LLLFGEFVHKYSGHVLPIKLLWLSISQATPESSQIASEEVGRSVPNTIIKKRHQIPHYTRAKDFQRRTSDVSMVGWPSLLMVLIQLYTRKLRITFLDNYFFGVGLLRLCWSISGDGPLEYLSLKMVNGEAGFYLKTGHMTIYGVGP
jgi:hypothetical protein